VRKRLSQGRKTIKSLYPHRQKKGSGKVIEYTFVQGSIPRQIICKEEHDGSEESSKELIRRILYGDPGGEGENPRKDAAISGKMAKIWTF